MLGAVVALLNCHLTVPFLEYVPLRHQIARTAFKLKQLKPLIKFIVYREDSIELSRCSNSVML
jgi:hypothetical protein